MPTASVIPFVIPRRLPRDCYLDGNALCRPFGEHPGQFFKSGRTKEILALVSETTGIPVEMLYFRRGKRRRQYLVHPEVVHHLAYWASVHYQVHVCGFVAGMMNGYPYTARMVRAAKAEVTAGCLSDFPLMQLPAPVSRRERDNRDVVTAFNDIFGGGGDTDEPDGDGAA